MPLTFIDIERRKSWRIAVFFLALVAIYFAITALLASTLVNRPAETPASFWITAFLASLAVAAIHFWTSSAGIVGSVLQTLDAAPPDSSDGIHRMFRNIIDEMHAVTGNRRRIRAAVIPSLSMNALAAADLRGNAVIAITEGLLSRLSRSQVEAVVAHEAHHILSGDCLETSIASGLFGTSSAIMDKLTRATRGRVVALPAVALAWLLLKLGNLLRLFISREREYRADAAAVRMTRNPVALAETLHLLSRSHRGAGFIGEGLEMLCIVNPEVRALDETEGFIANLLSTHPPIGRRISILLRMARVSIADLDRKADRAADAAARPPAGSGVTYRVRDPQGEWIGPLSAAETAALPWLTPLTWITTAAGERAERAWTDAALAPYFAGRLREGTPVLSRHGCPRCRQPLVVRSYESTEVRQCRFCAGILLEQRKISRIIARREQPCTERVNALARAALAEQSRRNVHRTMHIAHPCGGEGDELSCPECGHPMFRTFFSASHLVETDRCGGCGLVWFDRDELEMLQCMIENRLVPGLSPEEGPPA